MRSDAQVSRISVLLIQCIYMCGCVHLSMYVCSECVLDCVLCAYVCVCVCHVVVFLQANGKGCQEM